jgi:hypothetical protein
MELSLHIILQKPPANVDFGLQKGSGSKYETVQTQRSNSTDLHFYLTIMVKGDRQKDSLPKFSSPFIQGPYPNNFIYLDIGRLAGQIGSWERRLKIPLTGATWEIIDQLKTESNLILQTKVPGAAKDGTPNCATVKPFAGWKITSASPIN